jgi:hypothetical protein
MEAPDVTAMSCVFEKFGSITRILGRRLAPLVPRLVEYICARWDSLDGRCQLEGLKWTQWHARDAFRPFVLRLAHVLVAQLGRGGDAAALFNSFVDVLAPYIDTAGHVVYPAMLEWVRAHAPETAPAEEALKRLRELLKCGPAPPFAAQVVRATVAAVVANRALAAPALDALEEVARVLGPLFAVFRPALQRALAPHVDGARLQSLFAPRAPADADAPHAAHAPSLLPSVGAREVPLSLCVPRNVSGDAAWGAWWERLAGDVIEHSESRGVRNCRELSERLALVRDALFPAAFALMYVNLRDAATAQEVFAAVMQARDCPGHVVRAFLSVLEILEVLGAACPVPRPVAAGRAVDVGALAHALRLYEDVYRAAPDADALRALSGLNQRLGQPLAAAGCCRSRSRRGRGRSSLRSSAAGRTRWRCSRRRSCGTSTGSWRRCAGWRASTSSGGSRWGRARLRRRRTGTCSSTTRSSRSRGGCRCRTTRASS